MGSQGSTFGTILLWLSTLTETMFETMLVEPHWDIMNKIGLYGLFKKYGQIFNKYLKIKACVLMSGHLYPLPKQLEHSYCDFVMFCNEHNEIKNKDNKWNRFQCESLHTMSKNDEWVNMEKTK